MKTSSIIKAGVLSLPLSLALKIPHHDEETVKPIPGKSYVSAFMIKKDGSSAIECWRLGEQSSYSVTNRDGTIGVVHETRLDDYTEAVVVNYPPHSRVLPVPSGSERASRVGAHTGPVTISMKEGLLQVFDWFGIRSDPSKMDPIVLSPQNGDDWLYFEDERDQMDTESPLEIRAISNAETELLALLHAKKPNHKKIHDGPCRYNGIRLIEDDNRGVRSNAIELNLQIQEV